MGVDFHALSRRQWAKAAAVGIANGGILAVVNVIALKSGLSLLPKPLGLAFAETLFGRQLPLPVGLLFHMIWVGFFSVVYVVLSRDALTLKNAGILAAALWLFALAVFFPIVGWGFFGLAVGPRLIVPVTVSHLLFAVILWTLSRLLFGDSVRREQSQLKVA
jgi:hypothetical protein